MKIYLIDGNAYIHRAFHAMKRLTNSAGFPTGAIYGFTTMMIKLIQDIKPDAIAIAFDSPTPTQRHLAYSQYKAQRPSTPDALVVQIPKIKELVKALGIASFELSGYEADDIIGTIATKLANEGNEIFIVSSDKDMMQLVNDKIKIFDPLKNIVVDKRHIQQHLLISPSQIIDFMALTGDASDNIPGVKGIGQKTAAEILSDFKDINELIANTQRLKNQRIQRLIIENIENIKLSKTLATIDCAIPIDIDIKSLKPAPQDNIKLFEIFKELEFKSLMRLLPTTSDMPDNQGRYHFIQTKEDLVSILASAQLYPAP